MKTKRAKVPEPQEEITDDDSTDASIVLPDMAGLEAEQRLGIFHEKFGEKDYKVRVELFNKEENDFEIVDCPKLDGFDPFTSLKKYGGGRYRLSLLNEGGKYVTGGRMEVRIAKVAVEASTPSAPDNDPLKNPVVAMLLAASEASRKESNELLKAVLARPEPQRAPMGEALDMLIKLKSLNPERREDDTMKELSKTLMLKMIEKGLESGAEGGESGVMSEVMQAVKVASEMGLLPRRGGGRPPQAPPKQIPSDAHNMAAGVVMVNPAQAPAEAESPMKPVIEKAQSYVPQLIAWAQRGKDIEEAAVFVLDELEHEIVPAIIKHYHPGGLTLKADVVWSSLIEKANNPNEVASLFEVVPALAPYKEWFERVIATAVEMETMPDEPEAKPEVEVNGNHAP